MSEEIRLFLFGPPRIEHNGVEIHIGRQKVVGLLAYMAIEAVAVSREKLAAMFWPEEEDVAARANLRHSLSLLRTALGSEHIISNRETVRIDNALWIDTREFDAILHKSAEAVDQATQIRLLEEAIGLFKDGLLTGIRISDSVEFDDWSFLTAESYKKRALETCNRLTELYEASGNFTQAIEMQRRVLMLEPQNEAAHCRLMRLYSESGNRSAALHQFTLCKKLLAEEGEAPDDTTLEVYEHIRHKKNMLAVHETPVHRAPSRKNVNLNTTTVLILVVVLISLSLFISYFLKTSSEPMDKTLAVLPFSTIGEATGKVWFGDCLLDLVTGELSRIDGLQVVSKTSVLYLSESEYSPAEMTRKLGADFVIEGALTFVDNRLLLTVRMVRTDRETNVWAHTYEHASDDILAVYKTVTKDIGNKVNKHINAAPAVNTADYRVSDPEAFEAYLMGRYYFEHEPTPEGLAKSLSKYQEAIEINPEEAVAWSGLAHYYWGASMYGIINPEEGMRKANRAAQRALELDEHIADVHTVLGFLNFYLNWDWSRSEECFTRAIELAPSSYEAHMWYASLLSLLGRSTDSIEAIEKAYRLNPFSLLVRVNLAARYFHAGLYSEALRACKDAQALSPDFYMAYLVEGWVELARGAYDRAIAVLEKSYNLSGKSDYDSLAHLAYAYARNGQSEKCREILHDMLAEQNQGNYISPFFLSHPYLGLGDIGTALDLLETAYDERDGNLIWNFADPILNELREKPRFKALRQKLKI